VSQSETDREFVTAMGEVEVQRRKAGLHVHGPVCEVICRYNSLARLILEALDEEETD
jgi:hypothetical protein